MAEGEFLSTEWTDIAQEEVLQVEGINRKGFGLLPKLVMVDHTISITAKAIYSYLCAQAGSGDTAYPGRDKIVHDLHINKETYYVHMKQLTEKGYIKIKRERTSKLFERNTYKLCVYVKSAAPPGGPLGSNIKTMGYGTIPRLVVCDPELSAKAKALYGYFVSFKGKGEDVYPQVPTLLYHMDISRNTYKKILTELTSLGYVVVSQAVERGRLSRNYYHLPEFPKQPNKEKAPPDKPQKECVKIPDMINPDVKNPDIIKPDVKNPDTTINSPPINSSSIITSIYQQSAEQDEFEDFDLNDEADISCIIEMCEASNPSAIAKIPLIDRLKIEKNISKNIGLDFYPSPDKDQIKYLISLVASTLRYPSIRVHGTEYSNLQFVPKLLKLTVDEYQWTIEKVGKIQGVNNIKAYYIACLFNAHEDMLAEIEQQVKANN